MTILELQYFVEVAQQKNFTKAAEALFVTEPTISYHIKKLEKKLGTTLISRTTKYVTLTPEGEHFYTQARIAVDAYNGLKQLAESFSKPNTQSIRLGMTSVLYEYYVKQELDQYQKTHGETLKLLLKDEDSLLKALQAKQIDFAIIRMYEFTKDYFDASLYDTISFFPEPVYIILSPKLIQKGQTSISPEEIGNFAFYTAREDGYIAYILEKLRGFCKHPIQDYNIRADDFSVLLSAVSEGKAITLAGKSIAERLTATCREDYAVGALPIEPGFRQSLQLVYLKNRRLSEQEKDFFELLKSKNWT